MIIYNIKKNGPYEKDKMILNVGQLHNKVEEAKDDVNNCNLMKKKEEITVLLDSIINSGVGDQLLLLLKKDGGNTVG